MKKALELEQHGGWGGVETAEQAAFLRAHGVGEMQGFLFAKALPGRDLAGWLRARKAENGAA